MSGAAQTARMVLRAPEARAPLPIPVPTRSRQAAQAAAPVRVSQPSEPAEQEAERVAQAVLARGRPRVQRGPRPPGPAHPVPIPYPNVPGLDADGGRPLPSALRRDMEPRFGADFSGVRVHTGNSAARASRRLNAAAFTAGSHIAFGRGRFQPERGEGRRLIAHELTHTIQQRGAAQPAGVRRSVDANVRQSSEPRVMRLGVQDALDYFADKAAHLPGFTMLTLLLGFNPVNLRPVQRNAANLLRALIQLLPGGALISQALDNHGLVERVAAWVGAQLTTLGELGASIRGSIDRFLDDLSWTDIFDLGGLWARAQRIVTAPIERIVAFGRGLVADIVDFVKDAILRPLAALAEGTRGYPLLRAVLGFDPITGDPAERSPATLIGGFMTLIGQQEIWLNIQRGNAVARAWVWFQDALAGLIGFVRQIPTLYLNAFRALGLIDIVVLPRAFAKVFGVFAGFYGRFFSWAGGTVLSLLEIIFSVVAPGVMPYLRRAGAAFVSVLRNPVGFGLNLVRALKAGFTRFATNFVVHLTAGIIDWLTGSLPGVHIPRSLSLPEILKFVLSVLGLTWANLRAKLVRKVGEPAVVAMEKGFEVVKKLVTEGPVAAWEQLKDSLADLKQMAIDAIVGMVTEFVVIKAIPKLISLFIPGPGFITAAIAIYDTIMTFIRQLGRIAALVKSYLDAFMAIAGGVIDVAAGRIEAAAARYLSLIVSILAGMLGFGKVADRVRAVLERIRRPIDRAMDKVVDWVVGLASKALAPKSSKADNKPANTPKQAQLDAAMEAAERVVEEDPSGEASPTELGAIQRQFGLKRLELVRLSQGEVQLEADINPRKREKRKLTNRQRLNDCIKHGLHGKKVRMVGSGNPQRAAELAAMELAKLRRTQSDLSREAIAAENRLIAQERLARARGIPEADVPAATGHARDAFQRAQNKLRGVEAGIAGIEHEEHVASIVKPDLRNVEVICDNCENRIAEFDMIKDKTILEAKITVDAVKVAQVKEEQRYAQKLWGDVAVALALPAGPGVDDAVRAKFSAEGEPAPEVRQF